MARQYDSFIDAPPLRALLVPIISTLAGSAMSLLPVVANAPLLPPCGLLMFLSWRLLRPEMWAAWIALPLGLADDLLTGHFLGTSMALWTVALLVMDWIDNVAMWRDFWIEWLLASGGIIAIMAASWALSQPPQSHARFLIVVPQMMAAILLFPAILRLTAALDSWRLRR